MPRGLAHKQSTEQLDVRGERGLPELGEASGWAPRSGSEGRRVTADDGDALCTWETTGREHVDCIIIEKRQCLRGERCWNIGQCSRYPNITEHAISRYKFPPILNIKFNK